MEKYEIRQIYVSYCQFYVNLVEEIWNILQAIAILRPSG